MREEANNIKRAVKYSIPTIRNLYLYLRIILAFWVKIAIFIALPQRDNYF